MYECAYVHASNTEVALRGPEGVLRGRSLQRQKLPLDVWRAFKAMNGGSEIQRAAIQPGWKVKAPKIGEAGVPTGGKWLHFSGPACPGFVLVFPQPVPPLLVKELREIFTPKKEAPTMGKQPQVGKKFETKATPRAIPGKGSVPGGKKMPAVSGGGMNLKKG
jgi:hypothetical protein